MKDFYDIRSLSRDFPFDGTLLSEAIKQTFARRGTQLPEGTPLVFTSEFFEDEGKQKQWEAFSYKNRGYVAEMTLESVCKEMAKFLMPIVEILNDKGGPPGVGQTVPG